MGGFKQLDNDLPAGSLEELEKDFSLTLQQEVGQKQSYLMIQLQ